MAHVINAQIRQCIDSFVTELHGIVRLAVVTTVTEAFGGSPSTSTPRRAAGSGRTRAPRSAPSPVRPRRRAKGQKRDPKDLAALTETLGEYIARNPGKRIEDVARALGTTTKELQLPARKLIEARRVSTKGVKRATTYYPTR